MFSAMSRQIVQQSPEFYSIESIKVGVFKRKLFTILCMSYLSFSPEFHSIEPINRNIHISQNYVYAQYKRHEKDSPPTIFEINMNITKNAPIAEAVEFMETWKSSFCKEKGR